MAKIDMMLYKEIGNILKRERMVQKVSLDNLVKKIGNVKTKSSLKRYEDGASRIDMNTLSIICNALNLNYADVIREAEDKVKFYSNSDDTLGNYNENIEYLASNAPDLVELYNEIRANDNLVILFDKAKNLSPEDLEQVLRIIDTFNKESR